MPFIAHSFESAQHVRHAALANLFVSFFDPECTSKRIPCQLLLLCKGQSPSCCRPASPTAAALHKQLWASPHAAMLMRLLCNIQEHTAAGSSAPTQQSAPAPNAQPGRPAPAPSAQPGKPDMRTSLDSGPRSFPLPDDVEAFSAPGPHLGLHAAFWTCFIDLHGPLWHSVRGLRLNQGCAWQVSLSPQVQHFAERLLMSLRASCRQLPALRATHRSRGRVFQ